MKQTKKQAQRRIRETEWEHIDFLDQHPVIPMEVNMSEWYCATCNQRIRPVALTQRET